MRIPALSVAALVALASLAGCPSQQPPKVVDTGPADTGDPPPPPPADPDTYVPFDAPCEDTGTEIPVNFNVLTSDTGFEPGDTDEHPTGGVPRGNGTLGSAEYPGPYLGAEVFAVGELEVLYDQFRQLDVTDVTRPLCPGDAYSDGVDDRIASDSGCVAFYYWDHNFRIDLDAMSLDPLCDDLLGYGDPDTGVDASDSLAAAVDKCTEPALVLDGAINFYVWDNPDGNDSHGRSNCPINSGSDCHPYVILDKHRLLHTTSSPEEHEFGHAFGLSHVCDPAIADEDDTSPSNIMQRGEHEEDLDEDGLSETVCGGVGQGSRATSFGVVGYDPYGVELDPPLDQVEEIAGHADQYRTEWCDTAEADAARYAVAGDPACQAGTGTYALVIRKAGDKDHDGVGWTDLVPVLVSGQPMSARAWITSATLTSAGSASVVKAARPGTVLRYSATDALLNNGVTTFSQVGTPVALPAGRLSAAARWVVEGVDLDAPFTNPTVSLTWSCANVPGSAITELTRPTGYLLPLSSFGAAWTDAIVVRPNFAHDVAWFEVRGRPHDATRVRLHPNGARSTFTLDLFRVHAEGELWMQGANLKFRLVSGTAGGVPLAPFTKTLARY